MRILILGGYGTFGSRLVQLLENEARLTLIVAGRSLAKAAACCAARGATPARQLPAAFDRDAPIAPQLAALAPELLVDASGPFQAYGADRYRVPAACLGAGVDYLDLADDADFVLGIGAFDAAAKAGGRSLLSGVSSFPVLSTAVVRWLAAGLTQVERIEAGVAPSPHAQVGRNVIGAIAAQAGQRIPVRRAGREAFGHPIAEQRRRTIAPPGLLPLRSTLFSLIEVPDLRLLAAEWPAARDIWIGAGPRPELLHRLLIVCAWLVRLRLLPSLAPFAGLMHAATRRLRWGERRGGMFVRVTGRDGTGASAGRSWHLVAEGDAGPFIPAMPAAVLIRRRLAGGPSPPGARIAVRELELADIAPLFAERGIRCGQRAEPAEGPLFARLLGAAWAELPAEIQAMHRVTSASGRAVVERGRHPLARLAAAVVGFPAAAADVPVRLRFEAMPDGERWTRSFGGQPFASRLTAGRGRSEHLLCERFGPLVFAMALVIGESGLALIPRRWSLFGVPLPLWLAPRVVARESAAEGRFRFDIALRHPLCGPIVRYRGWLVPDEMAPGKTVDQREEPSCPSPPATPR